MIFPRVSRLLCAALAGLLVSLAGGLAAQERPLGIQAAPLAWVGTWGTSPQPAATPAELATPLFQHQTLRQIVRVSLGGNRVRVRLSNAYGKSPLVIGEAQVALQAAEAATVPGSSRMLTFKGQAGVTLQPGATVMSDPVALRVPGLGSLAVSLYLPQPTAAATQHLKSRQSNYVSIPGNFAAAAGQPGMFSRLCTEGFSPATCTSSWYFIAGVDVQVSPPAAAVVALGDSTTNGAWSTANANRRWTDVLARRLAASGQALGVLNQGIGGNTLVAAGPTPSGLKRFERDVLQQPGARFVIVLLGINDLRNGVSAERLIAGHRTLIARARERGLKIFGATLPPHGKAGDAQEAQRQALNQWMRSGGEFDAVIDFDAALRDPAQPRRMLPLYDCGDSLHPNDAGYEAMGRAVELSLFQPLRS